MIVIQEMNNIFLGVCALCSVMFRHDSFLLPAVYLIQRSYLFIQKDGFWYAIENKAFCPKCTFEDYLFFGKV